jgi:2-octaprenyl-6-methoxyphenol hydroxylase
MFDIVIAGGGPVGSALALGLCDSGYKIALLEARTPQAPVDDGRTLALSHGSRLILDRLGVWQALAAAATPIRHITVTQQRGFGRVELRAAEAGVPALGYVANYALLQRTLAAALDTRGVQVMTGQAVQEVSSEGAAAVAIADTGLRLAARLIVIADGGARLNIAHVKTRDYHQSAVVCDIASEQSHRNRAFERFTPQGPLALLPAAHGWSVVWTAQPARAQQLAALDDAGFCRQLQEAMGGSLGAFSAPGARAIFPLALRYATRPVAPRTLLIGNAAQTLHPVAGQGFNLGLRDAWELARAVTTHAGKDPGGSDLLNSYFSQRRLDRIATILFTDSLIRLFCNDIPLLSAARGLALTTLGIFPGVKNFLARRMMFGARG